jgi:diaminopropionate ammonia-lyase family
VAAAAVKLEAHRFTVGSFKALGPPYALECELARRGQAESWTAVAATSGNHGRALAWGATRLGARARIFMPAHTSAGREAAIRALGAETVRVPGDFDAAAAAAAEAGAQPGHILVADLPVGGRLDIPHEILHGYAALAGEIAAQSAPALPTHLFVAAGNGSLAAACCARLSLEAAPPRICAVEPLASDAIRRSLAADRIVAIESGASLMDGLVVGASSPVAWPILRLGLDAALAIPDSTALAVLREAAGAGWGSGRLPIGETGIAALAGLVAAATDQAIARRLGIDGASRLVAIGCEGVTDPAVLAALVGGAAEERT